MQGTSLRAARACSAHLCPAISSCVLPHSRIVASYVCSELASERTPTVSSLWPALPSVYGVLPWWFCCSDNSLKGEPSLYKFTCLPPLLLLCVCIHRYMCVYIYTRIHMHICIFSLFRGHQGQQQKFTTAAAGASCRPVSPGCVCSLCWWRTTGFTGYKCCLYHTDLSKG